MHSLSPSKRASSPLSLSSPPLTPTPMSSAAAAADNPPPPEPTRPEADQRRLQERLESAARDVVLWRSPRRSLYVLAVSTALWAALHPLGLNCTFVTAASWAAIAVLTSLFLFFNLVPLLGRDPPDLSALEVSEPAALEAAASAREWVQNAARRVLHAVVVDRDWCALVRMVGMLAALAWLGSRLELLTLLYVAVVASLAVPPVYVKHEERIKGWEERARGVYRGVVEAVDEKVVKRVKRKLAAKEKKTE